MTRQFTLPDLGEGLEEAEIVAWLVNEGDHVIANQPLVSVETDKAVVEIPSPWSGTIARLFGTKGGRLLDHIDGDRFDSAGASRFFRAGLFLRDLFHRVFGLKLRSALFWRCLAPDLFAVVLRTQTLDRLEVARATRANRPIFVRVRWASNLSSYPTSDSMAKT